ncbi:DNA repair protein RAD50 [Hondaea fermentalgiana]|uniref:DNA repair protein RAD50 n=1 Tax=Hondaea fermentalgiana TaxID=2315210 RepID=A0A2R5GCE6_9STRA|nr:DNA repair protein RAD50 [Hondaea fermentalgiana]|eukprot:GBG25414.1 DNA repair protein RAD50 [Hondaea fermentalgiana]
MEAEDSANTSAPRGATLSRLAIRGVRSFGPDEEQVIRFDKPLTVISGQNGAGKTTVLECLKYATTGQLPPGANNGQGFVHDPKMAGVTEVKAEVKLVVQTRASERRAYFVSRKMKLTQRRTKLEFKQLEGLLKMKDRRTGQEETMSGKCSDLDRMVPLFMGVSSAILQSVIFCHQEDSSWPLQESSVLKKKFDDIFDSTRYSKALDEVKKQKKRLNDVFRDAKERKSVLESQRKHARDFTDDRNELLESISTLQSSLATTKEELNAVEEKIVDVQRKLEETDTIRKRLAQTKITYDVKREALRELRDKIGSDVLSGNAAKSTSEIETQREQVRAELESYEKRLAAIKVDAEAAARKRERADAAVVSAEREEAVLKEKLRNYAASESKLLSELHVVVVKDGALELADRLKAALDAPPVNLASSAPDVAVARRALVAEALQHVRERARDAGSTLEARTNEVDAQRDEARAKLAEVRSQVSSVEATIRELRSEEASKLDQMHEIQDELSKMDGNFSAIGSRVAQLDQNIAQQAESLKQLEASVGKDDPKPALREADADIVTLSNDLRDVSDKIEQLEAQHDQVQDYRRLVASARDEQNRHPGLLDDIKRRMHEIHLYEEELADDASARLSSLEQSVQLVSSDHHEVIASALETTREGAEGVAADLGAFATQAETALATAEAALKEEGLKIAKIEQEKTAAESSLASAHKELATLAPPRLSEAVQARLDDGESEDAIRKILEKRVEKVQGDYYDFVAAADYLNTVLEKLSRQPVNAEHACPACMRPIGDTWSEEITERNKKALQTSLPSLVLADGGCEGHATRLVSWRSQKHAERCIEYPPNKELRGYDLFRCMLILQRELSLDEGDGSRKARLLEAKQTAEQEQKDFEKAIPVLQMRARVKAQMTDNEKTLRDATEALSASRSQQAKLEAKVQTLRSGKLEPATTARDVVQSLLDSCLAAARHATKAGDLGLSTAVLEQAVQTVAGESPLQAARLAREDVENKIAKKRAEKERLQEEWQRKQARLQRAQTQLSDLRNRRIEMREQSQRFEELSKRKNLVVDERQKVVERIARETKIKSVKAEEVQRQEAALAAFEAQRKDELGRLHKASSGLTNAVANANGLVAQLDPEKLAETDTAARANLETLRNAQQAAEAAREDVRVKETETEAVKRDISELEKAESQLDDIVRFYRDQAELAENKTVRAGLLAELQEKIDGHDTLEVEKDNLDEDRRKLEREEASMAARANELERQCAAIEERLQSEELRNIEERYRAAYIEARTTKMAADDLDKYYKALDTALMRFHSMKIEEINRRIAELWGVMYRGGDIDRIEIRSEGKTTANRRSYNYRVVMTKGDTQLDMRGRCSAGQRVMAALVIRMALAETFSINCGILSVDEPTVNLDEPNKIGLANALAQVLKLHKESRFFQLILITHDQDFVDRIAQHVHNLDMEANYYNVTRHINVNTNKYVSRIAPLYADDDHRSVAS